MNSAVLSPSEPGENSPQVEHAPPLFLEEARDGKARAGRMRLPHGEVTTPIFMPVGTVGSVKSVSPGDLRTAGAQIILGNTYHLWLRPGTDVISTHGDLHRHHTPRQDERLHRAALQCPKTRAGWGADSPAAPASECIPGTRLSRVGIPSAVLHSG